MRKIEKELRELKTPIERIFHEIVKRKMSAEERRILMGLPKKTRKQK